MKFFNKFNSILSATEKGTLPTPQLSLIVDNLLKLFVLASKVKYGEEISIVLKDGKVTPLKEFGYIKDGLYLYLDADDFDGGSVWIDRALQAEFVNVGVSKIENYAYFVGNQSLYSTIRLIPYQSGTIEIVFLRNLISSWENQVLLRSDFNAYYTCFGWNNYNNYDLAPSSSPIWVLDDSDTGMLTTPYVSNEAFNLTTFSINTNECYINCNSRQRIRLCSYFSPNNTNKTWIGLCGTGQYYKGKLYCIRIYNRKLSANEIIYNLQIDMNRFF